MGTEMLILIWSVPAIILIIAFGLIYYFDNKG